MLFLQFECNHLFDSNTTVYVNFMKVKYNCEIIIIECNYSGTPSLHLCIKLKERYFRSMRYIL